MADDISGMLQRITSLLGSLLGRSSIFGNYDPTKSNGWQEFYVGGHDNSRANEFVSAIEYLRHIGKDPSFNANRNNGNVSAQIWSANRGWHDATYSLIPEHLRGDHRPDEVIQTRFSTNEIAGARRISGALDADGNMLPSSRQSIAEEVSPTANNGGDLNADALRRILEQVFGKNESTTGVDLQNGSNPQQGPVDQNANRHDNNAEERDRRADRRWRSSLSAMMFLSGTIGKLGGGMERVSGVLGGALSGGHALSFLGPWGTAAGAVMGVIPSLMSMYHYVANKSGQTDRGASKDIGLFNTKYATVEQAQIEGGLSNKVVGGVMRAGKGAGLSEIESVSAISNLSNRIRGADENTLNAVGTILRERPGDIRNTPLDELLPRISKEVSALQKIPSGSRSKVDMVRLEAARTLASGNLRFLTGLDSFTEQDEKRADKVGGTLDGERGKNIATHAQEMVMDERRRQLQEAKIGYNERKAGGASREELEKYLVDKLGKTYVNGSRFRSTRTTYGAGFSTRLTKTRDDRGSLEFSDLMNTIESELRTLDKGSKLDFIDMSRMGTARLFDEDAANQDRGHVQNQFDVLNNAALKYDSLNKARADKMNRGLGTEAERMTRYKAAEDELDAENVVMPGLTGYKRDLLGSTPEEIRRSELKFEDALRAAKKSRGLGDEVGVVETKTAIGYTDWTKEDLASPQALQDKMSIFLDSIGSTAQSAEHAAESGAVESVTQNVDKTDWTKIWGEMSKSNRPANDVHIENKIEIDGTLTPENATETGHRLAEAISEKLIGLVPYFPENGTTVTW